MKPGCAGRTVSTGIFRHELSVLVPHEFSAVTHINPPEYVLSKQIVIDSDVDVPVAPGGSVHVYELAPETGVIE